MRWPAARIEFGDFQTPPELSEAVCNVLWDLGIRPASLLEPTCGRGSFLRAGLAVFGPLRRALAFDIHAEHVRAASAGLAGPVEVRRADFFSHDWRRTVRELPEPLLVLGNPPWVTNAALGAMGGGNLPVKSNFEGRGGLEALTGKSNFDISEYMLMRLAEVLEGRHATLAMLSKTAVARRLLAHRWRGGASLSNCRIFPIDAHRYFRAAVDACLLVASFRDREDHCTVHEALRADAAGRRIGWRDGCLVSDVGLFARRRGLAGTSAFRWRSGLKHDCAPVMEFREHSGRLLNGFGEPADFEKDLLYPMCKGSTLADPEGAGGRWVLVTQCETGDDTSPIAASAPKTWRYLVRHGAKLDARASKVYRGRPRFAVFGVGPYSFAPWKVAVSGLHKTLRFVLVGPRDGRPVMLDDTCYFLAFQSRAEAETVQAALNSAPAREFYSSLIFWDAKRPVTAEVLKRLSVEKLPLFRRKQGEFGGDDVHPDCPAGARCAPVPPGAGE